MTETHELRPVDGARGPLVLEEGQEGYDEARRIHNGLIDKRPALIYECQRECGRCRCRREGSRRRP